MSALNLPFDTTAYDALPISTMVYEPVRNGDGSLKDFRLVYGNAVFERDWKRIYHSDSFVGECLKDRTLMDEYSLGMLERFLTETPHSFSTYMPMVNLHLHLSR